MKFGMVRVVGAVNQSKPQPQVVSRRGDVAQGFSPAWGGPVLADLKVCATSFYLARLNNVLLSFPAGASVSEFQAPAGSECPVPSLLRTPYYILTL